MKKSRLRKGPTKRSIKFIDHNSKRLKMNKVMCSFPSRKTSKLNDEDCQSDTSDYDENQDQQNTGPDLEIPVNMEEGNDCSEYYLRMKKRAELWSNIRSQLLKKRVENEAYLSEGSKVRCINCRINVACARCNDCGGNGFYCISCIEECHKLINVTHTLQVWKEDECRFIPLDFMPTLSVPHECTGSVFCRELLCSDITGIKKIKVLFCSCYDEIETITMLRLFPATPKSPNLVFTFKLFDWLEALFLECQTALQDVVTALNVLYSEISNEYNTALYPVIINSFEEYRFCKNQLRSLKFIVESRDNDGTSCPACHMSKCLTISIDGNFGLCRKKAAGNSISKPLHCETGLFCDQQCVDKYVTNYSQGHREKQEVVECNQFLASNALRSSTRYKALDETGLIGVVCKHEFPLLFYSLKHGERISYIVYALEELNRKFNSSNVKLLYDVACSLVRHLQLNQRNDLLSLYQFAVPVFHSYGHKVDCQLSYNPRNLCGFGMTDGECCERLWSFLRRFSRTTKESTPSHRVDMLTDALLYYGRISSTRLETLLPQRFNKFKKVQSECKEELEKLIKNSPVIFTVNDIEIWYKAELNAEKHSSLNTFNWEDEYYKLLKSYYALRNQIDSNLTSPTVVTISNHLIKLDQQLITKEQKHGIQMRPLLDSVQFKEFEYNSSINELKRLKKKIGVLARERWFLLVLKAKFADGQYLASRLSKSITKASVKLKKLLAEYNSFNIHTLKWEEITNLASHLWYEGTLSEISPHVPSSVKLKAIEQYHTMLRCDEETNALSEEMNQTINFYINDLLALHLEIKHITESDLPLTLYEKGCVSLLRQACFEIEARLIGLQHSFSCYTTVALPYEIFQYHSPTSSNDESSNYIPSLPSSCISEAMNVSCNNSPQVPSPVNEDRNNLTPPVNSRTDNERSLNSTLMTILDQSPSTSNFTNEAINTSSNVSVGHIIELSSQSTITVSTDCEETRTISDTKNDDIEHVLSNLRYDSSEESDSDGEEFNVINWRKNRLEREEYLQELTKYGENTYSDLASEYKDLLTIIKSRPLSQETYSGSFLQMNADLLRKAVKLSASNMKFKGPFFHNNKK